MSLPLGLFACLCLFLIVVVLLLFVVSPFLAYLDS